MAADAVGYSRLMAADDQTTVATLDAARAVLRSHIESNQGRIIDMAGDSVLAVFEDVGGHNFKNIARAVRVFRIISKTDPCTVPIDRASGKITETARRRWFAMAMVFLVIPAFGLAAWLMLWKPNIEPADLAKLALALPDRPSIAVLPFENFSDDNTKVYFADGVTDDIINDLSKVLGLFVVARNSSFAYKDKPVRIRQVAEDLGVRYVLEGSVRRSTNRIRVTAQLIDALKGNQGQMEHPG